MKRKLLIACLLTILLCSSSFSQLTGTWALTSNKSGAAGGTQLSAIALGDVIPGENFAATATHNIDGIKCQQNIGNWPSAAKDSFHLDFPFSPNGSYDISLTGITFTAKTSGSSGANVISLAMQTNGSGTFTPFGTIQNANSGGSTNVNFGTLSQMLPAGSTYIIRMYIYASGTSTTKSRTIFLKNVVFTGSAVLPLNLLSFEAKKHTEKKSTVVLDWQTDNEINTSLFNIEKSFDGINFKNIGSILANNNSGVQQYQFIHTLVPNEQFNKAVFYRLKLIDKDGKYTYSKTIYVAFENSNVASYYPNPAKNIITLNSDGSILKVYDIVGRKVIEQQTNNGSQQINIGTLKRGIHLMFLNDKSIGSLLVE